MKFGSREIADVYFKARANMKIGDQHFIKGQPVLHLDTCTATNLESASTTVYAQGGKGNARLIAWDGERTLTFTVTDALMSPIGFAILSGAGVIKKATADNDTNIFVHTVFKAPIDENGDVRIDLETAGDSHDVIVSPDAPIFGTVLDDADAGIEFCTVQEDKIELLGHCNDVPSCPPDHPFSDDSNVCGAVKDECTHQYSITEAFDLVIHFGNLIGRKYSGRTMMVDCYSIRRSGAMEILVDAEHFGGNFYVEASTLFRDQATGEDLAAEFIIPNAKIQSNFTFAMSSSGDPSTFDFVMDAFPAYTKFDKTHKCLCALQVIGGDQDVAKATQETCEPLPEKTISMLEVIGGYDEELWTVDGDWTQEVIDIVKKLGKNYSTTMNGTDVDFYGTLLSGVNLTYTNAQDEEDELVPIEDQTGYYMPIYMKLSTAGLVAMVDKFGKYYLPDGATAGTTWKTVIPVDQDTPVISFAVFTARGEEVAEDGDWAIVEEVNGEKKYYAAPEDAEYYAFDLSQIHFA